LISKRVGDKNWATLKQRIMPDQQLEYQKQLKLILNKHFLILLTLNGLAIVVGLISLIIVNAVRTKPIPQLVQINDGQLISTEPRDPNYRSDEVIKNFVTSTFQGFYEWTGLVVDHSTLDHYNPKAKRDSGFLVKNGKLTTSAYHSGYALTLKIREAFLNELASIIPTGIFEVNPTITSTFVPTILSHPERNDGQIKMTMVGEVVVIGRTPTGFLNNKVIPLNKEIIMQVVEPTLPKHSYRNEEERGMTLARQYGLEIIEIKDLTF
jgi:hypothetical protein